MSYALLDVELGLLTHMQGTIKRSITMRQLLSPSAPKSIGCRIEIQKLPSALPEYVGTVNTAKEREWFVEDGGFSTSKVINPDEGALEGLEFTLLSRRCVYRSWEEVYNAAKQLQQGFGFGYADNEDETASNNQSKSLDYYINPLIM